MQLLNLTESISIGRPL